jgi:hypothetical protein
MNQVMDLTFTNVNFNTVLSATSDDGSARYRAQWDSNTVNHVTMNNVNIVPLCSSPGPSSIGDGEWFQANSGHWTWTNSTIGSPTCPITGIGDAELGRYSNVNHNTFYIAAKSGSVGALQFDSLGSIFDYNIVNQVSGDFTGINAGVYTDFTQVCNHPQLILGCTSAYTFNYNITNNTFNGCSASGGACLFLDGAGDVVTGNTFHLVGGNATRGIQLYYHPGDFHINNNIFPGPANNYAIQGNLSNNGWEFIGNTGANQGVAFYNNSTGTCTVRNNSTFGSYSITKGTPGNLCSISNNN